MTGMKNGLTAAVAAAVLMSVSGGPALALSDEEKAAIAILGVAALAHNANHYRDDYRPTKAADIADFERGYRDGLHNDYFDPHRSTTAYAQGYDAGHKERANSLSHKASNVAGTKVPYAALESCVNDAASSMGVGTGQVHAVKAGQEGADNFYIELAAGHRHFVCAVNSKGQIFDTRFGRL
jgi:hypothetical protein